MGAQRHGSCGEGAREGIGLIVERALIYIVNLCDHGTHGDHQPPSTRSLTHVDHNLRQHQLVFCAAEQKKIMYQVAQDNVIASATVRQ